MKPIGAAVKAEADAGQRTAAVKKVLSDQAVVNHAGHSQERPANSRSKKK